jgi:hypothetical protein
MHLKYSLVIGAWSLVICTLQFGEAPVVRAQTCYGGFCYPQQPTARDARYVVPVAPNAPSAPAAHCRIYVGDGSVGSGTLIARNDSTGLVLTCSHLFDQAATDIVVAFADGNRYGANLVERDAANDLAAVLIRRPNAVPVVVDDSEPTGILTACGYGSNGAFQPATGAIAGMAQAIGATAPSVKITGCVRPGDSGGGVLDSAGRLVGVVWGCRDGETYLTCGRPLREFLDRVWRGRRGRRSEVGGQGSTSLASPQSPAPSPDLNARFAKIEGDIVDLRTNKQDRGDYLRPGDLNGYARSTDVPLIGTIHARIEERIGQLKPSFFSGMSLGKVVAGALGLSSPVALAVMVAGGLAGRRLKKRRGARIEDRDTNPSRSSPLAPRSQPIAVDSPPPPQQMVPETHFVPVEKDDFARAHQWASSQVARKYPGAAEVLTTLDSLIKQQLAGSKN